MERKGRGRPPKDQKRAHLNLRVSPAMRDLLVALAEQSGRSLTQQVELLLELAVRRELEAVELMRWRIAAPEEFEQWALFQRPATPELAAKFDRFEAAELARHAEQVALREAFARVGAAAAAGDPAPASDHSDEPAARAAPPEPKRKR